MTTTTTPKNHRFVRVAPATTFALRTFEEKRWLTQVQRHVLLTMGALADSDLHTDGYDYTTDVQVAAATGLTTLAARRLMNSLKRLSLLETAGTVPPGVFAYRIPQSAFDYSNEV